MREHNIKDNAALQAYFTERVQKLVTKHGKITVGWDEVLQPDTPKDVVIQSWRGQESLAQAARGGYRGILSTGYYIDLNQPASQHYAVDPMEGATAKLTPEQQKLILGGEAAMWSEFVTPENVGSRIWPRTAAIAERLWSPQDVKNVDSMYARLAIVSEKLTYFGQTYKAEYEQMLNRLSDDQASPVVEGARQRRRASQGIRARKPRDEVLQLHSAQSPRRHRPARERSRPRIPQSRPPHRYRNRKPGRLSAGEAMAYSVA